MSLRLIDIIIKVRYKIGDIIKKECICDSRYMFLGMNQARSTLETKYCGVEITEPTY